MVSKVVQSGKRYIFFYNGKKVDSRAKQTSRKVIYQKYEGILLQCCIWVLGTQKMDFWVLKKGYLGTSTRNQPRPKKLSAQDFFLLFPLNFDDFSKVPLQLLFGNKNDEKFYSKFSCLDLPKSYFRLSESITTYLVLLKRRYIQPKVNIFLRE